MHSTVDAITRECRDTWQASGRGSMLIAVSGGADSTALLLAMVKAGAVCQAAHCNFNLRGEESLRDREFVKRLCAGLDIPLHIAEFDTVSLANKGESIEMTCRRLRYDFFRKLKEQHGFNRIAIAHNSDDNAETFFINALRGCGSRGLKGMEPDDGEIVRPLLRFNRNDIVDFLQRNNQEYIVDSTNLESDFRRNFLRNDIFPLLRSRWPGFDKAIGVTIDNLRKENRIIRDYTETTLCGISDILPWHLIDQAPDATTLIHRFIYPYTTSFVIADEIAKSMKRQSRGKSWILNACMRATTCREGLKLEKNEPANLAAPIDANEDSHYIWTPYKVSEISLSQIKSTPLSEAWLPSAPSDYVWKQADREMKIKSLGVNGSQKIWKILKDAGLTVQERENFKVLIHKDSGEPIWVPGYRRSCIHLIDSASLEAGSGKGNIFKVTPF